ncbi:MAG: hypothetical protein WCW14_01525 [Candidatus Paceibacterota bacterium]|jgi:uncharacterized membrane-anchored protein
MKKFLALVGVYALPAMVSAQSLSVSGGLDGFMANFSTFLGKLVPIIIALVIIFYLWETFQYFWGDEDKKKVAKKTMWEGIIVIAVIISIWGLVAFIQNSFGLSNSNVSNVNSINSLVPKQ